MDKSEKQLAAHRLVKIWLAFMALLVFAMVLVGGATRLTDSGLSITEWQPILGAIPPLSDADWSAAFEKYRQIPEYKIVNRGMSLEQFKQIYWWEWSHRFLGRFIGIAFALPLAFFWITGRLDKALKSRLSGLLFLGAIQGALGWFMVKSGLVDRVDVSQYRLAAHLCLAAIIYAAMIWIMLGIGQPRRLTWPGALALGFSGLVIVQIALGGLVAGLDAGMAYNTWPLMDGAVVPDGLAAMQPAWKNLFENIMTVQFNHRVMAYALALLAFLLAVWQRHSALLLAALVLAQIALGIATLLQQVPIHLALAHQAGALIILAAALWHGHRVCLQENQPASA